MHEPASPPLPSAGQLVWWPFAALLAGLAAAGVVARAAGMEGDWTTPVSAAWYVGWGAWTLRLCRRHGIRVRRLAAPPRRPGVWSYALLALPLLLLSAGVAWLQLVLASLAAPELVAEWLAKERTAAAAPLGTALGVLVGVVLAPVVEELVFRGVLLRSWARRHGRVAALLGTAALFAVLHPGDLPGAFAFGVVLGVVRWRTGTLRVPIACHVLHNALAELLGSDAVRLPFASAADPVTVAELQALWWVGAACVFVALLVTGTALHRGRRRSPPAQ